MRGYGWDTTNPKKPNFAFYRKLLKSSQDECLFCGAGDARKIGTLHHRGASERSRTGSSFRRWCYRDALRRGGAPHGAARVTATSGVRLALGSGATGCEGGSVGSFDFELSLYSLFTLLSEARLPPARLKAWYNLLGDHLLAAAAQLSPPAPVVPQPAAGSAASACTS